MQILSLSGVSQRPTMRRSDALAIDDEQLSDCNAIVIFGAELCPAFDREMKQLETRELHDRMQTLVRVPDHRRLNVDFAIPRSSATR